MNAEAAFQALDEARWAAREARLAALLHERREAALIGRALAMHEATSTAEVVRLVRAARAIGLTSQCSLPRFIAYQTYVPERTLREHWYSL